MAHVNAIRVDGQTHQSLGLDLLADDAVEVGIQILALKLSNVMLSNGGKADWMWDSRIEASLTMLGKLVHQISPEISKLLNENSQPYPVYGFCSDKLQDLAAVLQKKLAPHEYRYIPKVKQTDHFPYQFTGKLALTLIRCHSVLM